MQRINSDQRKRSKFSNFVYPSNVKSSNGFRAVSFVERLNDNICNQSAGSFTTINLSTSSNNTKYLRLTREFGTQTAAGESSNNKLYLTPLDSKNYSVHFVENKIKYCKMIQNHCEGDTGAADYEPQLTQEDLESLPFDRSFNVINFLSKEPNLESEYEQNVDLESNLMSGSALTKAYMEKNLTKLKRSATEVRPAALSSYPVINKPKNIIRSQSYVEKLCCDDPFEETDFENCGVGTSEKQEAPLVPPMEKPNSHSKRISENTQTELKTKSFSFMSPTISSERKNQSLEIKNLEHIIGNPRKVRSMSPRPSRFLRNNIKVKVKESEFLEPEKIDPQLRFEEDVESRASSIASENSLAQAMTKLRDLDWNTALRGLAEVVELCKVIELDLVSPNMTFIYQRLIELIKSPRSHVSRTSCQAVGHIFEYVKDTRRPEFDELVDSLLCKCADSNRFIRHDANLALDCMVTHIPTFHAVRAICCKGPSHKNPLVRTAAARILVCAIVLAGPQAINHPSSNEYTRKRVIMKMAGFLEDRSPDVRKYGERIYKMLSKDKIFEMNLNRFLEKDVIIKMKKIMKDSNIV